MARRRVLDVALAASGLGRVVTGRAVGVRRGWAGMPPHVYATVAELLGSPVVDFADQDGGFSPGCATRVRTRDGRRAFVKAVGAELNPDTPALFRRELEVLSTLGSHPLWADLIGGRDDPSTGWVVLVLEDVEGTRPDLSDDAVMALLLESTDALGVELRRRAGHLRPAPDDDGRPFFAPGPVDLGRAWADWDEALAALPDLPADVVPRWLVARAEQARADVAAMSRLPMTSPCHYDIRDDNLIGRPDGRVVFVDWGAFAIGPAWLDPLLARLERVDSPWFDASLPSSPALAAAGDELVTTWLIGMGTNLAYRAVTADRAVEVNLPTLAAFRRQESARFLAAAARRLGF